MKKGGRKQMPQTAEVEALCKGRMTKRHVIMLPGTIPIVMNLKPSTVVQDVIVEVTKQMERNSPLEAEEYALFLKEGPKEQLLRNEDYLFDLPLETGSGGDSNLFFKRLTWILPSRG